jgi:hypothetical protein
MRDVREGAFDLADIARVIWAQLHPTMECESITSTTVRDGQADRGNRPQPRSVPERIPAFLLGSDTDWQAASITHATAQQMIVGGLIERDQVASR